VGKILDRNKFKTERSGVFAQGVLTAAEMFFVEDSQESNISERHWAKCAELKDASAWSGCAPATFGEGHGPCWLDLAPPGSTASPTA
jgi:hypothetical protein